MKKIVIIGASSGLGLRMAMDFARVGCRVGIAARRTAPLEEIKALYPDRVAVKAIDVREESAVKDFYDLIELIDGMDILLYASGVGFQDSELNDQKIRDITDTNCTGFARILAAAYRYYRDTANVKPGQIAAITSIAGTKGIGVAAAYSASKRFQRNFIDALEQLAYKQQVNVKFSDIRPGFIRTSFLNPDTTYPMELSVNRAAPLIETAVLRAKRVAYIDSRWGIVNGMWSMLPQCLWKHVSLNV